MLALQEVSTKAQDDAFIALIVAAVAVGVVGARLIFGAWISTAQRHIGRWVYLTFGATAMVAGTLNPVLQFGMQECQSVLAQMQHSVWLLGWVITLLFYAGFASPVLIVLTALRIMRSPGSMLVAPSDRELYIYKRHGKLTASMA